MKTIYFSCLLLFLFACNMPTTQQGDQGEPSLSEEGPGEQLQDPESVPTEREPRSTLPPGVAEVFPYEVRDPLDLSPQAQLDYQAEWDRFNEIMDGGADFNTLSASDQEFVRNFEEVRPQSIFFTGTLGDSWYEGGGPYKLSASSVLAPSPPNSYYADNAHDFDLSTAWVEGNEQDGIGESISYFFKANSPPVTEVHLYNGYVKSATAWKNNNRVKALKVLVDGVVVAILRLEDTSGLQKFQLGQEYQSNAGDMVLEFEIVSVYKGDKYEDTAISELEFDGTGVY